MAIPKKVAERLISGLKRYQPILASAKLRDVGETDTVTIIKDMLADVFGYDKYFEVTSEYAIRGTYCDLAIKLDGKLTTLIEVKAVGIDLKEQHIKQAVDYAANQGVDWVLLTTGLRWCVYHVHFTKPIQHELVVDLRLRQARRTLRKRPGAPLPLVQGRLAALRLGRLPCPETSAKPVLPQCRGAE